MSLKAAQGKICKVVLQKNNAMWKWHALYSLAQFWILTTKLVNVGIFSTHDLFLFLLTAFDQKLVHSFWCLSNSPCSELSSKYVTVTSDVHRGVCWSSRNKTTSTKYTDSDTNTGNHEFKLIFYIYFLLQR